MMLQFNPKQRVSVDVLIGHKFFNDVRNLKKEKEAPRPISLQIDDFEDPDEETLRKGFMREAEIISSIRNQA